jgi:hypothetical protein
MSFSALRDQILEFFERSTDGLDQNHRNLEELTLLIDEFIRFLEFYSNKEDTEDLDQNIEDMIDLFIILGEFGYNKEEDLRSVLLPLWKPFPKFLKLRYTSFTTNQANRVVTLLLAYCKDGFQMVHAECLQSLQLQRRSNSEAAPAGLELNLETFSLLAHFLQRLSICSYVWRDRMTADNRKRALLTFFEFYGFFYDYLAVSHKYHKYQKHCLLTFIKSLSLSFDFRRTPSQIPVDNSSSTASSSSNSQDNELQEFLLIDYLEMDWSFVIQCLQDNQQSSIEIEKISSLSLLGMQCFIIQFWGELFKEYNLSTSVELIQNESKLNSSIISSLHCLLSSHAIQKVCYPTLRLNLPDNSLEIQIIVIHIIFLFSSSGAPTKINSTLFEQILVRSFSLRSLLFAFCFSLVPNLFLLFKGLVVSSFLRLSCETKLSKLFFHLFFIP